MKEYVLRGMQMQCSKGCAYRKINVKEGHGSYIGDQPLIIKTDTDSSCVGNFGTCNAGTSREAIDHMVTVRDYNGGIVTGPACKPVIVGDWMNPSDDYFVDGVEVITTDSKLMCLNGGEITFRKIINFASASAAASIGMAAGAVASIGAADGVVSGNSIK